MVKTWFDAVRSQTHSGDTRWFADNTEQIGVKPYILVQETAATPPTTRIEYPP